MYRKSIPKGGYGTAGGSRAPGRRKPATTTSWASAPVTTPSEVRPVAPSPAPSPSGQTDMLLIASLMSIVTSCD